jgi:protein-disulfide isomerase
MRKSVHVHTRDERWRRPAIAGIIAVVAARAVREPMTKGLNGGRFGLRVAVLLALAFGTTAIAETPVATVIAQPLASPQVRGPARAPVLVVVVGEYECPFCKRAETTLTQLRSEYGDQLRILWRHDPLPFHLRARPAAKATLAAERQGKFWAMHDAVFANADLSDDGLRAAAVVAGLDLPRYQVDVTDPVLDQRIDAESAQSAAAGVSGTPTFFINGKRLVGAQPQPSFRREVDAAIASAATVTATNGDLDAMRWRANAGEEGERLYRWLVLGQPAPMPRPPVPESAQSVWKMPLDPRDASQGDVDQAEVTLVEFTDFQCPFCSRAATVIHALQQKYGKALRVIVKHNPLPFHPLARPAAIAAIAAQRQGKFWPMHDKMFEHPQDLDEQHFFKWAKQLGLDVGRFRRDKADPAAGRQIDDDMALAESAEARGTPTFFINGRKVVGAQPVDVFSVVIDEEIALARSAHRHGQSWYESRTGDGKTFDDLEDAVLPFDLAGLPAVGAENPSVSVVFVTDHQCPFCARLAPTLQKLVERYPQQVRLVTVPWMAADHPAFPAAAQAAIAAWLDGGPSLFAKMDHELYAHSHELDGELVAKLAGQIGLKRQRLAELVASGQVAAILERANAVAVRGEAEATPTVFVNGRAVKHATASSIERAVAREVEHPARH